MTEEKITLTDEEKEEIRAYYERVDAYTQTILKLSEIVRKERTSACKKLVKWYPVLKENDFTIDPDEGVIIVGDQDDEELHTLVVN